MEPAKKPSFFRDLKGKVKAHFDSAVEIYARYDHRSLGLTRIGLGLLFLYNVWRRVPGMPSFYSNDGVLPNHTVLWRPTIEYMFSFFLAASRTEEAAVMFALCAIVFAAFTVGYRTRFTHVLSFACLTAIQTRQAFTMNGGDVALSVLAAWTMFLPMGARFSVDALRASLAARRERTAGELNDRTAFPQPSTTPNASLAYFAILLELAVIYYFNAVNKHGWTWRRGTAIHFVLYQERMVTWFGVWAREHMTLQLSRILSYTTLGLEYLAPILFLNPIGYVWTRRFAVIALPLMHLGFAAFLNVGQFSFNMIGFFPLLLSKEDWELFGRWLSPGPKRARTVHVREASPVGFAFARLLSRLDTFDRLRFAAADKWEVEDPATSRRSTGARSVAQCLAALPLGVPLALVLRLPGVRHSADLLIRVIEKREVTVARWLRLRPASQMSPPAPGPTPARLWFRRFPLTALREVAAAVLVYACTNQLLVQNFAVPQRFKPHQPKWVTQLIWYARLDQGWQMFSPDVPVGERHLYVDAVTFNGRHVDPYNEAASRVSPVPLERIPPHLIQDEFWCDYEREIFGNEAYWRALKEWVFAYHRRTGKPDDRIISFEARIIESDAPPPKEWASSNIRTKVMFSGREGT
jgi:hypothetical protein